MENEIGKLQKIIDESNNIVFFGGAGVSTESGIPDFRSQDGLYNQKYDYPPETILSHTFFMRRPEEFFKFYRDKMLCDTAKPNAAHLKLAEMEQAGKLKAVITQNIDNLHQMAGSKKVLELHGSVYRNHCMKCGKFYDFKYMKESEMQKQSRNLPKDFIQKSFIERNKYLLISFALVVIVFTILFSIKLGAVNISWKKVIDILLYHCGISDNRYWSKTEDLVVWYFRLPRALLACLAGGGLAISGVAMQAAVKNPLADPYILGISAGASAGATAVIAADILDITAEYSVSIGAFSGAVLSMALLFLLNKDNRDSVRLLLSGCVISILFSSVSSVIMFMAKDKEKISSIVFWLMGSVADANWHMVPIVAFTVSFGILFLLIYHRQLNALLLGEETAHTLGLNTGKLRWQLVLLVAIVVGSIVAFCGMIGFVGFVMPHIVRSMFGSDHKLVVSLSAFIGAVFLCWSDVVARIIVIPEELPIGIITSICGAPFFIYILKRQKYSFGGKR